MLPTPFPAPAKQQRGIVLFIALVILLLLTIIGVSGLRSSGMQLAMAQNMREMDAAFQAAESALRAGETWLAQQNTLPAPRTCETGDCGDIIIWATGAPTALAGGRLTDFPWETQAQSPIALGTLQNVATQPRYIIEFLGQDSSTLGTGFQGETPDNPVANFAITGFGHGPTAQTEIIVQSVFTRTYPQTP